MESQHPTEIQAPPPAPEDDGSRIRPTFNEPDPSEWSRAGSFLSLDFLSRRRLAAVLPIYYAELRNLEQHAAARRAVVPFPSVAGALALLNKASDALRQRDADLGWKCFHSAQRMAMPALEQLDPEYFKVVAKAVLHEAKAKLSSWRKAAVLDALTRDDKDRTMRDDVSSSAVAASMLILHEHFGNLYHKVYDSQRQLRVLAVILLVAAAAFLILWPSIEWGTAAAGSAEDAETAIPLISLTALFAVALFGAMGACISGIRQLAVGATSGRIPDRLVAAWITITRPVVGAVAAMVLYFFLAGGLFPIVDLDAGHFEAVLAVAFAAGFSEQLVWRAAERLTESPSG